MIPVHLDKVTLATDDYFYFLYLWRYHHCPRCFGVYFSVPLLQIFNHLSQEKPSVYGLTLFQVNLLLRKLNALFEPMMLKLLVSSSDDKMNSN